MTCLIEGLTEEDGDDLSEKKVAGTALLYFILGFYFPLGGSCAVVRLNCRNL